MKGKVIGLTLESYEIEIYLPPYYDGEEVSYPVVYVNGGHETDNLMEAVEDKFKYGLSKFILVNITPHSWNRDFSPWKAPALTKKEEAFDGEAVSYINFISERLKTYIDRNYRTKAERENTVLLGYSLGGLAALYAIYICSTFGRVGSLSGSLWYDGWLSYMQETKIKDNHLHIYLSLGSREEHSRNQRMSGVGDCTRSAFEILKEQIDDGENIILQWNEGGHFTDIRERFVKAIVWLMK